MPVIQKNARTISFRPFAKVAADRFCRGSSYFVSLHHESHAYLNDFFRETRNALAPGKGLDHQNLNTANSIEKFLLKLEEDVSDSALENLGLYEWTKHVMTIAFTDGVYGAQNPFRKPEVEASHWYVPCHCVRLWLTCIDYRRWQAGFPKMTAGLPSIFLRNELTALSTLMTAHEQYCLSDHSDASDLVRVRESLCDRYKASLSDTAGDLVGFNIGLLGNTVPTAFWVLYDIVTRPELLDTIRSELQQIVTRSGQLDKETFEIDVVGLRTGCPILLSSYQETQRFRNIHASIRKIIADTVIESPITGEKYFLEKGNYLQMPSAPIHHDPEVWGANAAEFDPYRFVKGTGAIPRDKLPESYAFMAWGIAPHVCAARQFASTEVMLFVAMMIMRFDIEHSQKKWKQPDPKVGELSTILPPKDEVFVNIRRRDHWQGKWKLKMGDSRQTVSLASG